MLRSKAWVGLRSRKGETSVNGKRRKEQSAPTGKAVSRADFLRIGGIGLAGTALLGAVAGCGGGSNGDEQAVNVSKGPPSYYPDDYKTIVEGSKNEGGQLTIYSNLATYNWSPIIEAFQQRYPWVEDVSTNNLDSSEVFQRYYNEAATGGSAADLMVSGSPQDWVNLATKRGAALDYESPETDNLPGWSIPFPGVYTFSTDPILIAYNTSLLSEDKRPTGIGHLAELARSNPGTFNDKITTYTVDEGFGFAIDWNYVENIENAWEPLETLLPVTRPEASSGPMVDKINSGEYVAGYFMSSTVILPLMEQSGGLLDWSYIDDGTPLFIRGMAIPEKVNRPNTAKLMLDFILSHDGQVAVDRGGLTPYREDLKSGEVARTYQSILNEVGEDNIVLVNYDDISEAKIEQFRARWNDALGA